MAETPRELAQQRAKELQDLRARLLAGEPITKRDTDEAVARAEEAKLRSIKTHLAASDVFESSAEAHRRAADLHDRVAEQHIGDPSEHRRAATRHRDAADDDLRAALEERIRAKRKRR